MEGRATFERPRNVYAEVAQSEQRAGRPATSRLSAAGGEFSDLEAPGGGSDPAIDRELPRPGQHRTCAHGRWVQPCASFGGGRNLSPTEGRGDQHGDSGE